MTPERFNEALRALRWPRQTLADALGCHISLVDAWGDGLTEVPTKTGAWLEALAQVHEGMEHEKPRSLVGKRYVSSADALPSSLEHIPVYAYHLLRRLGQGPVPINSLHGTEDEGLVDFLVSRDLAERQGDKLVIKAAGKDIGEIADEQ